MSGKTASTAIIGDGLAAFMLRVLGAVAAADAHDQLWWRCSGPFHPIMFFVNVNDEFGWGTADAEPVTPSTVDELEKAIDDVREAADGDTTYGLLLYACRRREMRPQGAAYPTDPRLWPLFDQVGPQREIDMFNPKAQPVAAPPEGA